MPYRGLKCLKPRANSRGGWKGGWPWCSDRVWRVPTGSEVRESIGKPRA